MVWASGWMDTTGLADLVYGAECRLRCPFTALGLTAEAASAGPFPL